MIKTSDLHSALFVALFLANGCQPHEQPIIDTPYQLEHTIAFGHSVWLHDSHIILGGLNNQLTNLYPPAERLTNDYLLFNYANEIHVLYADSDTNNQLSQLDRLLAITLDYSMSPFSVEGIGIGSTLEEINSILGEGSNWSAPPGTFIWEQSPQYIYWQQGVAFQFDEQNSVERITIFLPQKIKPLIAIDIGTGSLTIDKHSINQPFPRNILPKIFGNADQVTVLKKSQVNYFKDQYLLSGLSLMGYASSNNDELVTEITVEYPAMLTGNLEWDSTTDDPRLKNWPFGRSTNDDSRCANKMANIYTFGSGELLLCYDNNHLGKIVVSYHSTED